MRGKPGRLLASQSHHWGRNIVTSFFKKTLFLLHVYECFAPFMFMYHVSAWCPQRALNPLELWLQTVVSHCVGAGSWTPFLCKNSQCSSSLSYLSTPDVTSSWKHNAKASFPSDILTILSRSLFWKVRKKEENCIILPQQNSAPAEMFPILSEEN